MEGWIERRHSTWAIWGLCGGREKGGRENGGWKDGGWENGGRDSRGRENGKKGGRENGRRIEGEDGSVKSGFLPRRDAHFVDQRGIRFCILEKVGIGENQCWNRKWKYVHYKAV